MAVGAGGFRCRVACCFTCLCSLSEPSYFHHVSPFGAPIRADLLEKARQVWADIDGVHHLTPDSTHVAAITEAEDERRNLLHPEIFQYCLNKVYDNYVINDCILSLKKEEIVLYKSERYLRHFLNGHSPQTVFFLETTHRLIYQFTSLLFHKVNVR